MVEIKLPGVLSYENVATVLERLQPCLGGEGDDYKVDWSRVRFATPLGLTIVAAACRIARAKIGFVGWDPGSYCARMGVKPVCGLDDDYAGSKYQGNFTEVVQVQGEKELEDHAVRVAKIVTKIPGLRALCRYSLSEMLRNVNEHTFSRIPGAVSHCQQYSGHGYVEYAVVDGHVGGIRQKISTKWNVDTAAEAIFKAVMPGVSTGPADRNQGIGLTVAKAVACASGGKFAVLSESTLVSWNAEGVSRVQMVPNWPGTCILGRIPVDSTVSLREVIDDVSSDMRG